MTTFSLVVFRFSAATVILVAAISGPAAQEERLPFVDGTYASNPDHCKPGEINTIEIKGRQFRQYESFCRIRQIVRRSGELLRVRFICGGEGNPPAPVSTDFRIVSTTSFNLDGIVFNLCGRQSQVAEEFPLASCKGWSGTITSLTGKDSDQARLEGIVTKENIEEFCTRMIVDDRARVDTCIREQWEKEKNRLLVATASCSRQIIVTERNGQWDSLQVRVKSVGRVRIQGADREVPNIEMRSVRTSAIFGTSCGEGTAPIESQFQIMCPVRWQRMIAEAKKSSGGN